MDKKVLKYYSGEGCHSCKTLMSIVQAACDKNGVTMEVVDAYGDDCDVVLNTLPTIVFDGNIIDCLTKKKIENLFN